MWFPGIVSCVGDFVVACFLKRGNVHELGWCSGGSDKNGRKDILRWKKGAKISSKWEEMGSFRGKEEATPLFFRGRTGMSLLGMKNQFHQHLPSCQTTAPSCPWRRSYSTSWCLPRMLWVRRPMCQLLQPQESWLLRRYVSVFHRWHGIE